MRIERLRRAVSGFERGGGNADVASIHQNAAESVTGCFVSFLWLSSLVASSTTNFN